MRTRRQKIFFCICNINSKKKEVNPKANFFVKILLIFIYALCMFDTTILPRLPAVFKTSSLVQLLVGNLWIYR